LRHILDSSTYSNDLINRVVVTGRQHFSFFDYTIVSYDSFRYCYITPCAFTFYNLIALWQTVVDIINVAGTEYAILLPIEEENDEAIILKFTVDEEGNELLVDIEDDEEWEKVADAWEETLTEEAE
jgi:hypothetical protein